MCVVAEVFFEPDPTSSGETPASSDNLAQRNLAILHSDNPGGPGSHTVMHTFEVRPSGQPFGEQLLNLGNPFAAERRRHRLDELLIRWHNLPAESEVTMYFSDIDTALIALLAEFRRSPLAFEVVDKHTLKLNVAGATWLPIPGGRELNIPALLSIKLPDAVTYGQEFRVSIHQVRGADGRIIGACEFRIPVSKAELILDDELRSLSVFKHIVSTIPPANRWYPLMRRYVHHLGLKVDALGGDARAVHPNPDGSGRPYDPTMRGAGDEGGSDGAASRGSVTGLVRHMRYDCDGRFVGFTLHSCGTVHTFRHCERSMERLVTRACRHRLQLAVVSEGGQIQRVFVGCCGPEDQRHPTTHQRSIEAQIAVRRDDLFAPNDAALADAEHPAAAPRPAPEQHAGAIAPTHHEREHDEHDRHDVARD